MKLHQLRLTIQQRRKLGDTYHSIASDLGIERALVKYIETHEDYKPTRRTRRVLALDPDPGVAYRRRRREALDAMAESWGYPSWSVYETTLLKANRRERP